MGRFGFTRRMLACRSSATTSTAGQHRVSVLGFLRGPQLSLKTCLTLTVVRGSAPRCPSSATTSTAGLHMVSALGFVRGPQLFLKPCFTLLLTETKVESGMSQSKVESIFTQLSVDYLWGVAFAAGRIYCKAIHAGGQP